jgi:hypothetical protein
MPFRVFTVELHGGRRFEVDLHGAIVNGGGVTVFLAPGGLPLWSDHHSVNQIVGAPSNTPIDEPPADSDARLLFASQRGNRSIWPLARSGKEAVGVDSSS